MIRYECKKLWRSRSFLLFLVLFLAAHIVLAYVGAEDAYQDGGRTNRILAEWVETYAEQPDDYRDWYTSYGAYAERLQQQELEAAMNGQELDDSLYRECSLFPETGIPDYAYYQALRSVLEYPREYQTRLDALLTETEKGLQSAASDDQKAYLSQVRERYTALRRTPFSASYTYGFDSYFSNRVGTVFVLFLSMLAGVLLVMTDLECGVNPILYTTAAGRRGIVSRKLVAMLLWTAGMSVLFSASAFLAVYLKSGVGGWGCFLSVLDDYLLCPYPVYVFEYLPIKLLFLWMAAFLVGMAAMLFSSFVSRLSAALVLNIGVLLLQYAMTLRTGLADGGIARLLNVFSLANADTFFERYRAENVFGHSIPSLLLAGLAELSVILSVAVLLLCFFGRVKRRKQRTALTCKRLQIPFYEFRTVFCSTGLVVLVLLVVVGQVFYRTRTLEPGTTYRETVYRGYMLKLEGELTPEKEAYLCAERERLNQIFAEFAQAEEAYQNGSASFSEYIRLRAASLDAEKRSEVFARVEERYRQIREEGGVFVYDTGWKLLLNDENALYLLLLLLIPTFAYYTEKRNRFFPILQATKYGRGATFWRKAALIIGVLWLCVLACDAWHYGSVSRAYPLPLPHAALQNLPGSESCFSKLSIGCVLLLSSVWKLLNLTCLALCGICISRLSGHSLFPPLLACAVLFVPYLLKQMFGGVFAFFSMDTLLEMHSFTSGTAIVGSVLLLVCTACLCVAVHVSNATQMQK